MEAKLHAKLDALEPAQAPQGSSSALHSLADGGLAHFGCREPSRCTLADQPHVHVQSRYHLNALLAAQAVSVAGSSPELVMTTFLAGVPLGEPTFSTLYTTSRPSSTAARAHARQLPQCPQHALSDKCALQACIRYYIVLPFSRSSWA